MTKEDIFEIEKKNLYRRNKNYFEECVHPDGKKCYIFFSSNGLYQETTIEEFRETMVNNSRYEWKSLANTFKYHKDLGKIIYVRDIFKAFYIYGINEQLNTIDKLVEKLRVLTQGYQIITVGISSGGYMSVICAVALQAERAFCFSGQFNIESHLQEKELAYVKNVEEGRKYFDITEVVKQNEVTPIYYFCPVGCNHDYENYQMVKEMKCVRSFLFPDRIHASTVYTFNFPDILFCSNKKLDKLARKYKSKMINKNVFYFRTVSVRGFMTFLSYIWKTKLHVELLKKKWDV